MRVVSLYRVSTELQEQDGASLDAQQRRYRELAASSGWTTVAELRGQESAAKAASERVVLQHLLELIRTEPVDAVWVYEQSRLTRGDELEVALLVRELRERRIRIIVSSSERDLRDVNDSLAFGLQSVIDRAEWERLRERTLRGRRERAQQGRWNSGAPPYGYRNPPRGDARRGILQVHEPEAVVVRRIFRDVAAGNSLQRVADELNAEGIAPRRAGHWAKSAIKAVLSNPAYLGRIVGGGFVEREGGRSKRRDVHAARSVVEDAHEPLVTEELWHAARAQQRGTSTGLPHLLTGMLRISGRYAHVDHSRHRSYYVPADGGGPWVETSHVNAEVWRGYTGLLAAPEVLGDLLHKAENAARGTILQRDILGQERQRARLLQRRQRLVDMRADGEIPAATYQQRDADAARQIRRLEHDIRGLRQELGGMDASAIESRAAEVRAVLSERLSVQRRRRLLRSLVCGVEIEVADRGNPRERGGLRWQVDAVRLELHVHALGPDGICWGSERRGVVVEVIRGGELVEELRPGIEAEEAGTGGQ